MSRTTSEGVVHVDTKKHPDTVERNAYKWRGEGYAIWPMPVDDNVHPYNRPCVVCSEAQKNESA